MQPDPSPSVRHAPERSRFEIEIDGRLAVAEYAFEGQAMVFTHTEVPPELRGRDLAAQLARAGLEFARAGGHRVVPRCSYVARFLQKHPEYAGLVGGS